MRASTRKVQDGATHGCFCAGLPLHTWASLLRGLQTFAGGGGGGGVVLLRNLRPPIQHGNKTEHRPPQPKQCFAGPATLELPCPKIPSPPPGRSLAAHSRHSRREEETDRMHESLPLQRREMQSRPAFPFVQIVSLSAQTLRISVPSPRHNCQHKPLNVTKETRRPALKMYIWVWPYGVNSTRCHD